MSGQLDSAGHYKDLTETGNRARKVSGSQRRKFGKCLLLLHCRWKTRQLDSLVTCLFITNFAAIQLFLPVQTYLFLFKYGFYIRNGVKSLFKILPLFIWSQCLVYIVVFVNQTKRRDYWMYSAREEVHVYKKSWEHSSGSQCANGADDTILSDRPSESNIVFLFCLLFLCVV